MTIGQFAQKLGVSTATIRFYERRGFFTSSRQPNGYRSYSQADIKEGELILVGKAMNFTLAEIYEFAIDMRETTLDHRRIQTKLRKRLKAIDEQAALLDNTRSLILAKIKRCQEAEQIERKNRVMQ
ncbi:MAG: MerR family transcriptional regulator [Candidatus Saccharimonas sp.]